MGNYVALIPARGGSKEIPKKNIIPFAGAPLISHTIKAALSSKNIERCVVSTDDAEISCVATEYGAEVLRRPDELSTDASTTQSAVDHFLENAQVCCNSIIILQPTSPLRNEMHIDECVDLMTKNNKTSAFSGCFVEHHPYKFFKNDGSIFPLSSWEDLSRPRQLLPIFYRQNGAIYVMKISEYSSNRRFISEDSFLYLMEKNESVDIDSEEDLLFAEILFKKRNK
jgi:CMP-N,N'-diacetyllegionaminic acid synthase